jgi:hypothetical protein
MLVRRWNLPEGVLELDRRDQGGDTADNRIAWGGSVDLLL